MRNIFTCIAVFFCLTAFAQQGPPPSSNQQIKGKVSGTLLDATTGSPLSFASVVLRNPETNKDVNGTISEEDGSFKLNNIPSGDYKLLISFVGYETITRDVSLTPKTPDANLGNVKLTGSSTELEEVVVKGQKDLIENKIDKIVYNADQDVANAGGDASQVLRRAPLLNVDLEGNVSMRGNQNVKILINGKPSSMFASNPGEALKAIPSDNIKSVEVITTPSAKYEGEGTAGIINIITKKGEAEGFTGNVDLTVGSRFNRGSGSITAGKGRFGFNANISSFMQWPQEGNSNYYSEDYTRQRIQKEDGTDESNRGGYFGNIGAFYDFNAFHSLSTSFRVRKFAFDSDNDVLGTITAPSINEQYLRTTDSENAFGGFEWSLDYIFKFPGKEGHELAASYKLDNNTQDQDYRITQTDLLAAPETYDINEKNINDGDNNEHAFQLDYTNPISKKFTLEAGAKGILRNLTSDYNYQIYNNQSQQFVIQDNRSDYLDYNQDVYAGYLSGNLKLGSKYGILAGVRYEYTEISGNFRDANDDNFGNDYDNFLPNITVSRKIGKMNSLKASFSRRIQRPSLRYINPYEQISNNNNVSYGNPELNPELTDQYEVGYSAFIKGASLNASVFYKRTTDVIESYLTVNEDDIYETTYLNIGKNQSYGINLFTSVKFFKIWTVRGGFNLYTYDAEGVIDGETVSNDAVLWDGNLNSNITLGDDWIIDMFGFYRPKRQTLQGYMPSFSIFSMGIKKKIWGDRGSIGVNVTQPFSKYQTFGTELKGDTYYQTSENQIPFRSFGINFSYKFGKLDFKQRQRRSKIQNNDQKQGGDAQQSQF
ncbi:TonB-dependent receptor domain-containing protein [Fulvivirga sediminis]|uniref:TonB-dependent receptor n=1 Tax=Fulvivirga sediminis TaxID=2803949 RepID=A0A937F3E1_9BACT|nr:TonB-dependent receptor [Fulvivirga sediminis]MBL3655611.1 TonB-dependent receptor [Fulvivirga sediminis]